MTENLNIFSSKPKGFYKGKVTKNGTVLFFKVTKNGTVLFFNYGWILKKNYVKGKRIK